MAFNPKITLRMTAFTLTKAIIIAIPVDTEIGIVKHSTCDEINKITSKKINIV